MDNNNYGYNNGQPQQPYNGQPQQPYNGQPQQPYYNQPNPAYPQQPAPSGVTPRGLAMCIILSIITCGIYTYFWMYSLTEDVNRMTRDPGATSGGTVILLSIITCGIYAWVWLYKQGDAIDRLKAARGIASSNTGLIYLVLSLFGLGIVSYCLMQNEINKLCTM